MLTGVDLKGWSEVEIPDGVTAIDDYAFADCSGLTSVTIPDGVTRIGEYAFSGCVGLTSMTIPDSMIDIADYAFEYCSALRSVSLPGTLMDRVNAEAFYESPNVEIAYRDEDTDSHGKVQLWEGGPYWATTNIGAENPEDYGYYFWWGDTVGYTRENDKWVATDGSSSNFSFSSGNASTYGKNIATLQSEGWITADSVLAPAHDAAHVHWGGKWRMPTDAEFSDLINNCTTTWTTRNGVYGRLCTGKGAYADRSIFLPAGGYGTGSYLDDPGSRGYYWFSTPDSGYSSSAWGLYFYSSYFSTSYNYRFIGQSVRPVQGFTE